MKLMIVDDEYIVRQGLRKIVPWGELDIEIVGEAESVKEAAEVAGRVYPDIIICDIRLPGGEGFQVIDEIRNIVPWAQFVMITAHSDKEYMLQAIYKGACDYLFKPAKVEDIKTAVNRAKNKVLQYHEKMKRDLDYQSFIMDNLDVLRENFIINLLKGSLDIKKVRQDAGSLKLYFDGPCYRLLLLRLTPSDLYQGVQRLSADLEAYRPAAAVIGKEQNGLAVILNCREEESEGDIRKRIRWADDKSVLSKKCGAVTDLSAEYESMSEFIEENIIKKADRDRKAEEELSHIKQNLYEAVKYHDSAEEIQRLFFLYLERAGQMGITGDVLLLRCRSIMETIRVLTGITGKMDQELEEDTIKECFLQLFKEIRDNKKYPLDDISGKALYFIKKRYMEDLSLEQVAAELFMSSSYLSRILKERTGHGFAHWLNYYRIEAAKEKLKGSDQTIEQIASECGYNSYRIFSEHFRKYTGKTASVYRLELLK